MDKSDKVILKRHIEKAYTEFDPYSIGFIKGFMTASNSITIEEFDVICTADIALITGDKIRLIQELAKLFHLVND